MATTLTMATTRLNGEPAFKALCNATEDKVADEKLGLLTALSKGI